MAHEQAKRRKSDRQLKLPRLPWALIASVIGAVVVVTATFRLSVLLLDRPIRSIEINGPFQRVTALQIEEVISDDLNFGFLSADLTKIQDKITALPWIDHANVGRRWPGKIVISVTEQIPAASWGERGLLNTRGELFVSNASHVPAELPRLSGPADQAAVVAQRYLEIREQLIPLGIDVRRLQVDTRGAWNMTLHNGIEIRFGRQHVAQRSRLFLDVVANIISSKEAEIEYVDMRYISGFTIGWKNGSRSPIRDPENMQRRLVAGRVD